MGIRIGGEVGQVGCAPDMLNDGGHGLARDTTSP